MDQNDQANSFSDRFRDVRRALHLESPLEFTVVVIVVVCLLSGAGIWLSSRASRRGQGNGNNGAGSAGGPSDSNSGLNSTQAGNGAQGLGSAPAAAALGTIRITKQKAVGSTNSALPNGLEIVLLPDRTMSPVAMALKFSGEVGEIHSSIDSADVIDAQSGILVSSPDTVVLEWRTPPFGPFSPLLLTVFSKDKIKLIRADSIAYRYPYEGGDLK
jgi:hypothetical protein